VDHRIHSLYYSFDRIRLCDVTPHGLHHCTHALDLPPMQQHAYLSPIPEECSAKAGPEMACRTCYQYTHAAPPLLQAKPESETTLIHHQKVTGWSMDIHVFQITQIKNLKQY
jgi:hypothetical protein